MNTELDFLSFSRRYLLSLNEVFDESVLESIQALSLAIKDVWDKKKKLYICGNGGSAANAIHIANDFHFGVGCSKEKDSRKYGVRVEALSSNPAILTCLANDLGYEYIFSNQLRVNANSGDLLLVLSGSGNSPNIINALATASEMNMITSAIVGFDGGIAKKLANIPIHANINDMQISEDVQLIIGHLCMQFLSR